MAEDGEGNGAYQLITPPNLLKAKVGTGGAGGIDADLIKRAEDVIDTMSDEFAESVSLEINCVMKHAMDLEADANLAGEILNEIRRIAHDLRGQGGTYGYDLISDVAASLFHYTEILSDPMELKHEVLQAHADAMRAVIKNKVKGSGGEIGADLVQSLDALVERMTD